MSSFGERWGKIRKGERMKDINLSPCRWHMRIWDVDKNEWLHEKDMNFLPYYGFDIRGGEVTAIQGMSGVYNAFAHGKELIWEQSTGLKDKNGKEIYEGDIIEYGYKNIEAVRFEQGGFYPFAEGYNDFGCPYGEDVKVIGNIHENPIIVRGEE